MSSLLDEMGLDPADFEWQDLALCSNMPIEKPEDDIFYDKYESDTEAAKAADQVCLHCPVIQQCFFAGSKGEHGLWGGIYWNGAGKPDKNKNAHKTDDVWAAIHLAVSG